MTEVSGFFRLGVVCDGVFLSHVGGNLQVAGKDQFGEATLIAVVPTRVVEGQGRVRADYPPGWGVQVFKRGIRVFEVLDVIGTGKSLDRCWQDVCVANW